MPKKRKARGFRGGYLARTGSRLRAAIRDILAEVVKMAASGESDSPVAQGSLF